MLGGFRYIGLGFASIFGVLFGTNKSPYHAKLEQQHATLLSQKDSERLRSDWANVCRDISKAMERIRAEYEQTQTR